ncbi:MAG: CoA-acylating methylmalonate-semialdehyde dehydrogenase [Myxococcales bacterium]|nr:CoA-acylating methylmalonate-semialdehyde dehydrogenase [Myxococcales bacterium]MCB9583447.1 CoA-acylating methylmalonate-semialdehyde dehydrogenase [Polyangiaceae bacterium]
MTVPPFSARSYEFCEWAPARNYVFGELSEASTGKSMPVENPRHGKVMSSVTLSGAEDVNRAVEAARRGFEAWREVPIKERAQVFYRLKSLLERDLEELSWLVSHENGKTIEDARASVQKGIECVEFGASLPAVAAGEHLEVSRGVTCTESHAPLGVVAGVTPFNFPIMVPMWMLPQAIVGGNAFILKPSEQVPLTPMKIAALFEEAGLPKGVFNVVNGGPDAVNALVDHPGIQAMAFVGSTAIAKMLYARGAAVGRRMLCLGGAKNHLIVVPDADPAITAENVVASFTGATGQRCMAAAVLVAVGDVDAIIDRIVERAAALELGKDVGPVISKKAEERIGGYISAAQKAGATLRLDGRGKRGPDGGYWVGPTVIDRVSPDMSVACEEIFGPVLSILRVGSVDEAIALENASPYGNAASIYTTSGAVAEYVTGRVEAGMVGVNIGVPVPREPFGFGGWNQSKFGHGNITGMDGFRFWTRARKVTAKWALRADNNWMS